MTQKKEAEKFRNWTFTRFQNLETFDYQSLIDSGKARYIAYGLETCPTNGRLHHQGFLVVTNQQRISTVGKMMGCHVEFMKGNLKQNAWYCSKQNQLIKFGDEPSQGARKDLKLLGERVIQGESVDDIAMEDPYSIHMYGRTLDRLEDISRRKKKRMEPTIGWWLHGPAGSGKSRAAFHGFSATSHYVYENDNGWWDTYKGQEIVIVDDFRGGIQYNELLQLVDRYPKNVRRRCREPTPFVAKHFIITSVLSPEECFHNLAARDTLDQLHRRFRIIEFPQTLGPEVLAQKWLGGNSDPLATSEIEER